jgi:hypothetical protein
MSTEKELNFSVFAEHFQFYLQDKDTDNSLSIYWDQNSREALFAMGEEIVGIATVRSMEVPVTVTLIQKRPKDEPLDDWDHVVEASITLPTGELLIWGPLSDETDSVNIKLEPGTYGLRAYYGGLDEVDAEGFEGDDFYKIALWRTDKPPEPEVLKRWTPATVLDFSPD